MSSRRTSPRGPGLVLRFADGGTGWGGRLARVLERIIEADALRSGRRVARSGQVLSLRVTPGAVRGVVQGSQPDPFETVCAVRELDGYDRAEIVAQVRAEPGILTALASGEVPESLAERLLPADSADLDFDCTCPDYSWPCKHGAALLLLTAQEVGVRPLQILAWRGLAVDSLVEAVATATDEEPARVGGDPFAVRGSLPPMPGPDAGAGPAIDRLDTSRLRAVLRLWDPDTSHAERDLRGLYRRFMAD
ncbi:SWIM zinc finger family protein [Tomitella cavernea]|uniref:SWIM-type domain-containing protein n=1 Tax=Tomitella cavernea TaxID=1387982 RepID=A0ABP9CN24_9ACTN|nr:SWIM zinc finger family protein [Tomitella cavernea]